MACVMHLLPMAKTEHGKDAGSGQCSACPRPRTRTCAGLQPSALGDVREEPQFPSALYRARELALVTAACSGDPGRADLALLAHRPAHGAEVLVVDDVDLVAAELAGLAPAACGRALASVPPPGLLPATLLRHCFRTCLRRSSGAAPGSPGPRAGRV